MKKKFLISGIVFSAISLVAIGGVQGAVIRSKEPIEVILQTSSGKEVVNHSYTNEDVNIYINGKNIESKEIYKDNKEVNWEDTLTHDGMYDLRVKDLAGRETILSFTIDKTKPASIENASLKDTVLSGKTESDAEVVVIRDNAVIAQITASDDGSFSVEIEQQKVGTSVTAYAVDKAGNKGEFITINQKIKQPDIFSIQGLINKQNALPREYKPDDLVSPNVRVTANGMYLREEAARALENMFDAASNEGYRLYFSSGYRSYYRQITIFGNYEYTMGEYEANRISAKPGYSEHQSGLAADITAASVNYQLNGFFGQTAEGQWVAEHAYKYGYVIRYLDGKEAITGYKYEPWHLRYVGVEVATIMYEQGLTYDEFCQKYYYSE